MLSLSLEYFKNVKKNVLSNETNEFNLIDKNILRAISYSCVVCALLKDTHLRG